MKASLLLALVALFFSTLVFGQETEKIEIKGVVKDSKGTALQGITITEKNTANVSQTNATGEFIIKVTSPKAALVFSGVGFQTKEAIAEEAINIVMNEDVKELSDVVVVGYGTQKKVNLTGSISVVKGSELVNRPTATVSQALQGRVPGMNFTAGSYGFEPGAALNLQIRGQGTPLILVDGIYTSNINGLNPNDIESVSVLKDAAASAIYGARAPYGVVLITTKSGSTNNKLNIEYSGN